jgi:hypothetical protein
VCIRSTYCSSKEFPSRISFALSVTSVGPVLNTRAGTLSAVVNGMTSRWLVLPAALAAAGALAAAVPVNQGIVRALNVRVGETVEADVDYKMGYACDDTTILRAWMVTRKGHNWFIVEGVMPGRTWCRVGTDPTFPSYVFDVVVHARKPFPR